MMFVPTVDLICLANSRKRGGRCVAGLRADGGGWIRPVGPDLDGELEPRHYRLDDGTDARILDVIRVGLREPRPRPHQPENWLVAAHPRWHKVARPAARQLLLDVIRPRIATEEVLFGNCSDRIRLAECRATPPEASLTLAFPSELTWEIRESSPGRRQTRACFRLGDVEYNLAVTDPEWEYTLLDLSPGRHSSEAAGLEPGDRLLLTISLGDPYGADEACYKLIAAIVQVTPEFARDLEG